MELDRLAVRLRPRGGWEALDLGFHMARTWWRPVWGAWLAVFVPAALLLHFVLQAWPWLAMALTWWLKPAFDRFALHVVSRAVFGATPTPRETLAAWRQVLSPGLARALTIGRLDLARSFVLAVPQLERQSGAGARARRAALGRRMRGYGAWLTATCAAFEGFVVLSLAAGLALLAPGTSDPAPDFESLFGAAGEGGAWNLWNSLAWCLAIAAIEPFYVAAGFALYLTRRAILEGWDIELQLRRLDARLSPSRSAGKDAARGVAAALALVLALGAAMPAPAEAAPRSAREEVIEVLKAPELNPYREELRWRLKREAPEEPPAPSPGGGPRWGELGALLARLVEAIGWIAAAVATALVLWYGVKLLRARLAERAAGEWRPPEALFGLAVAPESLPDDVAGTAAALARAGRVREALSLLYRGALSVLVHRERVRLSEGDTEADALRAARHALPEAAAGYFGTLVGAWIAAAYAGRLPDAQAAERLAQEWAPHFAPPREAAA